LNPDGFSSGLAIFWDEMVTIVVDSSSENFINVQCWLHENRQLMRITFIHAPTSFNARILLWEELQRESTFNHLPWLCIEDFNEILYHWENMGKRLAEKFRLTAFRDFLHAYSLMDLESK